jgi:YD repeat-containing protein
MKRTLLTLLIINVTFLIGFSQDQEQDTYRNQYDVLNFKWLSPESFQMQESTFLNLENSLFYGRLEYNLPLYEINIGNIKVPITLNYSSNGLKVEQEASDVGFGWCLNTGGSISRMVKGGLMDNIFHTYYLDTSKIGWSYVWKTGTSTYKKQRVDQAPDEFVFSALGYTDRFIYEDFINPTGKGFMSLTGSNIYYRTEIEGDVYNLFPYSPTSLYPYAYSDYNKITVNLPNGIEIEFVPIEGAIVSDWLTKNNATTFDRNDSYTSWGIQTIYDHNSGRSIHFNYDIFKEYKKGSRIEVKGGNSSFDNQYISILKRRLASIDWDGGRVEFICNSNRQDKDYFDGNNYINDKKLDQIKIFNKENKYIKGYDFAYDYFSSDAISKTYKDYRLKLTSIKQSSVDYQSLPPYEFEYFNDLPFPSTDSKEKDYWGYFNNNNAESLFPTLYFYEDLMSWDDIQAEPVNAYLPFTHTGLPENYVLAATGVNRDANEQACKTGMLKKVTLPTGGYHEFDYELNAFNYIPKKNASPIQNLKGGGLRIISQTISDGNNTRVLKYNYNYSNTCQGIISRYPSFAYDSPSFPGANTSFSESSIFEPIIQNGSYVGYKIVEEIEIGNGKKQFQFNVPSSLFNSFSLSRSLTTLGRSSDMYYSLPDIRQTVGLIGTITYFDESGQGIKTISNMYNEKTPQYNLPITENVFLRNPYNYYDGCIFSTHYTLNDCFVEKSATYTMENQFEKITTYTYNDKNLIESVTKYNSTNQIIEVGQGDRVSPISDNEITYYNTDYYKTNPTEWGYLKDMIPYPESDYTSVLSTLENTHQIVPILQRKFKKDNDIVYNVVSDVFYHYKFYGYYRVLMDEIKSNSYTNGSGNLSTDYKINSCDEYGRPTSYIKGNNGLNTTIKWLKNYDLPLYYGTYLQNAISYFTSFEDYEDNFQGLRENAHYGGAKVGDYYATFNSSSPFTLTSPLASQDYDISFWYKGTSNITLNNWVLEQGSLSSTDWKYYTTSCHQCSPQTISFSNDISIDNLRIFPNNTQFTTLSYRPLIGVIAQTDMNGNSTNYDYDSFNRLKSIKDQNGNVLKLYDYNFGRNTGSITNITPPFSGSTQKSFQLTYSPGLYVTEAEPDGFPIRETYFTQGTIQCSINVRDSKTGVSFNVDLNITVSNTDTPLVIAEKIASSIELFFRVGTQNFYNVNFECNSNTIIVNQVNSYIETDVSGFELTLVSGSLQETPDFQSISVYLSPTLMIQNY